MSGRGGGRGPPPSKVSALDGEAPESTGERPGSAQRVPMHCVPRLSASRQAPDPPAPPPTPHGRRLCQLLLHVSREGARRRRRLPPAAAAACAPPPPAPPAHASRAPLCPQLRVPVPPEGHAGGPQAHGGLLQRLHAEPRTVCGQDGAGCRHRQRHPRHLCRQSGCVQAAAAACWLRLVCESVAAASRCRPLPLPLALASLQRSALAACRWRRSPAPDQSLVCCAAPCLPLPPPQAPRRCMPWRPPTWPNRPSAWWRRRGWRARWR